MPRIVILLLLLGLAACGGRPATEPVAPPPPKSPMEPRIVEAAAPLQCVPYARQVSAVALRGDAWTW